MKVIDLLNKIANGELKQGTKFKVLEYGLTYVYDYPRYAGLYEEGKTKTKDYDFYCLLSPDILLYEIEIIEEEKELEEIEIQDNRIVRYRKDKFIESMFNHFYDMDLEVRKKLNDAIKEIKKIKKEGK